MSRITDNFNSTDVSINVTDVSTDVQDSGVQSLQALQPMQVEIEPAAEQLEVKEEKPEVDVSKLEIGMIFKNYAELAAFLGERVSTGNGKRSQTSTWNRYFNWPQDGRRYIITEIYDIPLPKDSRADAVYVKYVELMLSLVLAQKESGVFYTTYPQLYKALNMVGSDYDRLRSYESTMNEIKRVDNEISAYGMWVLRSQAKSKLRRILNNALNSMQSRRLIFYSVGQAVRYFKDDDYEEATVEEQKQILDAEQRGLKKFGFPVIEAALNSKKSNEFKKYVNEYLEDNYGIIGHIQRVKIVYRRPYYMDEVVESILGKYKQMALEYYNTRAKMNKSVVDSFHEMVVKSHKRAESLYMEVNDEGWGVRSRMDGSNDSIKGDLRYVFDGEKFIDEYIVSEGEGRNENDKVFKVNVGKYLSM